MQVRAHVKKDDGRVQAYGWSLPTKVQSRFDTWWCVLCSRSQKQLHNRINTFRPDPGADAAASKPGAHPQLIPHSKTHVPVPVPVYCR